MDILERANRYLERIFGQDFANERLEIFFATVWRPLLGGIIASGAICYYSYQVTHMAFYWWFFAAYNLVVVFRYVSAQLYFTKRQLCSLPLWHVIFNLGMFANGVAWAVLGYWAALTGQSGLVHVTTLTLVSVVTVNLISYPSNRLSHYVYAPMVTFPVTIHSLLYSQDNILHVAAILVMVIFNPMVILASMSSFKVTVNLLDQSAKKGKLDAEIQNARIVQETLFPTAVAEFGNLSIAGFYEPAGTCGGDWWHYSRVKNKIYLGIGDATGHGLPAALITSAASSAFSIIEERELTPSQGLEVLNRAIHANSRGQMMMTFFMAVFDMETGVLVYANASHEPALLLPVGVERKRWKEHVEPLQEVNGPRLGESLDSCFKEAEVRLKPGEVVFFYTDGLVDAANSESRRWGEQNLLRTLGNSLEHDGIPTSAQVVIDSVAHQVRKHANVVEVDDDITFFALRLKTPAAEAKRKAS